MGARAEKVLIFAMYSGLSLPITKKVVVPCSSEPEQGLPDLYESPLEDPLGSPTSHHSLVDHGIGSEASDSDDSCFEEHQDALADKSSLDHSFKQSEVDSPEIRRVSGGEGEVSSRDRTRMKKKRCRKVCLKTYAMKLKSLNKRKSHKSTPFKCRVCRKGFKNEQARKTHMMAYSRDALQKCVLCSTQQFKSWTDWFHHSRAHSEGSSYKCDVCSQKFRFKSSLAQHRRKHLPESGDPSRRIPLMRDEVTAPAPTLITTDQMDITNRPPSCPLLLECTSDSERTTDSPPETFLHSEVLMEPSGTSTRQGAEQHPTHDPDVSDSSVNRVPHAPEQYRSNSMVCTSSSSMVQSNSHSNSEWNLLSQPPYLNSSGGLASNLFWHPSPSYASGPSATLHAINGQRGFQSRHQYYEYFSSDAPSFASNQTRPFLQFSSAEEQIPQTSSLPFPFHPLYAPYPSRVVAETTWQPPIMTSVELSQSQDVISTGQSSNEEVQKAQSGPDNGVTDTHPAQTGVPEMSQTPSASTDGSHNSDSAVISSQINDLTRSCHICGMICPDVHHWRVHLQSHKKEKPYECGVCKKKFTTMISMNSHKEAHGEDTAFDCHACGEKSLNLTSWRTHVNSHGKIDRPHRCDVCSKSFCSMTTMHIHRRTHEGEKPFKCNICGKGLSYKCSFRKHMRLHAGISTPKSTADEKCICEVCGKELANKYTLIIHRRKHTGERPFKCDICDKTFLSKGDLGSHRVRHSGIRSYKCDLCDKAYLGASDLFIHKQTHGTVMTHTCEICNEGFPARRLFLLHMQKHTIRESKECEVCHVKVSKTFLKSHMMTHTGEKPYQCDVCGKSFTLKNTFQLHMNMHNGIKPYQCDICQKTFSQIHSLKAHLTRIHSIENPRPSKVKKMHAPSNKETNE